MRSFGVGLIALLVAACGGESTANKPQLGVGGTQAATQGGEASMSQNHGGSGGVAGLAGTAGTRSFVADRGCRSDVDCPSGGVCTKYTPNGPAGCAYKAKPATSCTSPDNPREECCSSVDCPAGSCFSQVVGVGIACGLGGFDTINQCLSDRCQTDADCPETEICAPLGMSGPVRHCIAAACRSDADCTAAPGGACVAFAESCCTTYHAQAQQLACVYPSDGCQKNEDCAAGQVCVVTAGGARCALSCDGPSAAGTTP